MSDEREREFFKLRKDGKTYISKVFTFNERNPERVRQVKMVRDYRIDIRKPHPHIHGHRRQHDGPHRDRSRFHSPLPR